MRFSLAVEMTNYFFNFHFAVRVTVSLFRTAVDAPFCFIRIYTGRCPVLLAFTLSGLLNLPLLYLNKTYLILLLTATANFLKSYYFGLTTQYFFQLIPFAISMAFFNAANLLFTSCNSLSSCESATIPAPA